MLMPAVVGWGAATVVGAYFTGSKFSDVAFSMNGALGAATGYLGVSYAGGLGTGTGYGPMIGAIAVPALVGMQLDPVVVGMGAAYHFSYIMVNQRNNAMRAFVQN